MQKLLIQNVGWLALAAFVLGFGVYLAIERFRDKKERQRQEEIMERAMRERRVRLAAADGFLRAVEECSDPDELADLVRSRRNLRPDEGAVVLKRALDLPLFPSHWAVLHWASPPGSELAEISGKEAKGNEAVF